VEMALSKPEPEPNFLGVSQLEFSPDVQFSELEFVSNLQSETPDVLLGDTNVKVPGHIKGKTEAYRKANASQYVLDTVTVGYKLIFINDEIPPSSFLPNNKSALSQKTFLLSELIRLEKLGCIKKVSSRPHIVNPCSVVFSKKLRCVLDASLFCEIFYFLTILHIMLFSRIVLYFPSPFRLFFPLPSFFPLPWSAWLGLFCVFWGLVLCHHTGTRAQVAFLVLDYRLPAENNV
jgi:hypothetical protein